MFASTAYFVVSTVVMDTLPDAVLVGGACLVALVLGLAYHREGGVAAARAADGRTALWSLGGGLLAFWAAPLLALSQRATDAPSGADSLFLMTTACGVGVVVVAMILPAEKVGPTALSGAIAAAAGSAGLLASWETPSSFSPFAKFPLRESFMLLAAALFSAGMAALAVAIRRKGPRPVAVLALAGAAGAGVATALPFLPGVLAVGGGTLVACAYLGTCIAVLALGTTESVVGGGLVRVAVALFGAPVGVMLYAATERFTGAHGPDPVVWPSAGAGIAVLSVAGVVIWLAGRRGYRPIRWRAAAVPLAVSGVACALGVAQLATPALNAVAQGGTGAPFRAAWTMVGAESAVGWLAFASPWLVLSAVLAVAYRAPLATWISAVGAALVCLIAALPLRDTTLHTWNRWVPADVQQTYGTEYSRLVTSAHFDPVRTGALLATALAVVVLGLWAWRTGRTDEGSSS
jgi:hypothetical protein